MMRNARDLTMVGVVAAVMLLTNLGAARLWDRDEPRNAGCAAEMLARGDWVTPVFNNELRAHKPVLLYWLIMSAYELFGVNEFAARFWSAIIGIATCLATYDLGRRLFDRSAGCWAGVSLSTCLAFDLAARAATPDAALIGCTTCALWAFVRAAFPLPQIADGQIPHVLLSWPQAALMYGFMGLGVLAKGPVGCVLPTAIISLFLSLMRRSPDATSKSSPSWWQRGWSCLQAFTPRNVLQVVWSVRPLTGLVVILCVAAPWYVWVGLRTDGEFLREFFLEHNLGRATSSREGHHGPFLVYYVVAMLIGFFPWSVFAVSVARSATNALRERHPWSPGLLFAVCWVSVFVVLFSFAQTKLPNYIAPCYPALALLTSRWLRDWTLGAQPISRAWMRASVGTLAAVGAGWSIFWPLLTRSLFPGEANLALLGVIPLVGAAVVWRGFRLGNHRLAAGSFAVTAAGFVLGVFAVVVPRVDRHQQNELVLRPIREARGDLRIAAFGLLEPSWVYYGGQPIMEVTAQRTQHTIGVRDFFGAGENRFVLTTQQHWERLQCELPETAGIVAQCPLFLKKDQLLLIGVVPPAQASDEKSATVTR